MTVLTPSHISPPFELVNQPESVVIVSMKRPLCVYFDRVMDIVSKGVVSRISSTGKKDPLVVTITGCGGSIPRCKQIARYAVRTIQQKFKHQVKSVGKEIEISQEGIEVMDFELEGGEEDIVDMSPRKVSSVTIKIKVDFFD